MNGYIKRKSSDMADAVIAIIERDGAVVRENIRDEIEAGLWDAMRPEHAANRGIGKLKRALGMSTGRSRSDL